LPQTAKGLLRLFCHSNRIQLLSRCKVRERVSNPWPMGQKWPRSLRFVARGNSTS